MMRVPVVHKQISFILSLLISCLLTYQIIHSLSFLNTTISPEVYFGRVAVALAAFLLPIFGAWFSFHLIGGVVFTIVAALMALFASTVSKSTIFLWFLGQYVLFCIVLYRLDDLYENIIAGHIVDREKFQNEKNDLDIAYRAKGEGISIYFEKYSTYYHLRKLAEDLVSSLSVLQLSEMIVNRCAEFIPKGDIVLISLADNDGRNLSVLASSSLKITTRVENKLGDLFDYWVIRNRKRLIISDTQQDFRFDTSETVKHVNLRSLIIVPLLNEGRVIGTLRINASQQESFSNDDLRLLDAIGTLASSALSNAILFEKTEELAIKDSLTGLYVRRYFYDRLKHEHRRFLLTQRPLSLLMCDLDHFKECNDRFGHEAGDAMLVRFAEILTESSAGGFVARYGGEEFTVILTETPVEQARVVAEAIRSQVEKAEFLIRREKVKMTVSVGVANIPSDTLDIETLIHKADQALYQAKREGRNRVCLSAS